MRKDWGLKKPGSQTDIGRLKSAVQPFHFHHNFFDDGDDSFDVMMLMMMIMMLTIMLLVLPCNSLILKSKSAYLISFHIIIVGQRPNVVENYLFMIICCPIVRRN